MQGKSFPLQVRRVFPLETFNLVVCARGSVIWVGKFCGIYPSSALWDRYNSRIFFDTYASWRVIPPYLDTKEDWDSDLRQWIGSSYYPIICHNQVKFRALVNNFATFFPADAESFVCCVHNGHVDISFWWRFESCQWELTAALLAVRQTFER